MIQNYEKILPDQYKTTNTEQLNQLYHADTFVVLPTIKDNIIDLVICDGHYGVTDNNWDKVGSIQDFNLNLIKIFSQKLRTGGALYLFGKPNCIDFIDYRPFLKLQSKIVWYFSTRTT